MYVFVRPTFYYWVHFSFNQSDQRQAPPAKHHIKHETVYIPIIFQNFPVLKKYFNYLVFKYLPIITRFLQPFLLFSISHESLSPWYVLCSHNHKVYVVLSSAEQRGEFVHTSGLTFACWRWWSLGGVRLAILLAESMYNCWIMLLK